MIIIMYFAFLLRLLYYFLGFVPEDDLIFFGVLSDAIL